MNNNQTCAPRTLIDNYGGKQSSCYFLDLRNSTKVIRQISLLSGGKDTEATEKLKKHTGFMMDINKEVCRYLRKSVKNDYFYNDTGDGHLCLFWDEAHAWSCLKMACHMYDYLYKKLELHNKDIGSSELKIGFGFGMHTGGSLIYKEKELERDYAYGIVINSAARIESFNKNFIESTNFLFSHNFKDFLEKQFTKIEVAGCNDFNAVNKKINSVTKFNVDIRDAKETGHKLYTLNEDSIKFFAENISINEPLTACFRPTNASI